jgi:hypothetical protein
LLGILLGSLFITLSAYQFYQTVHAFKGLKEGNDKDPSPFALATLWSSTVIAVALSFAGMGVLLFLR